jgi:molecular chaperone DnaJ
MAHPVFARDGLNLLVRVPVSFTEAALGATVPVPTLDGKEVTVRIKPGTASGARHRVRDHGIATASKTGDLIVTVDVDVPSSLSDEEKAAVEALHEVLRSPRGMKASNAKAGKK